METQELLNKITPATDLELFFDEYEKEFINKSFTDLTNEYIGTKELRVSDIVRDSGQGEYVYKVLNGTRKPSRNIIIAIAFGMKLSIEETQLLLRVSKFAMLDPRDKRDSIIIYSLKSERSIYQLNDLLSEMNENNV